MDRSRVSCALAVTVRLSVRGTTAGIFDVVEGVVVNVGRRQRSNEEATNVVVFLGDGGGNVIHDIVGEKKRRTLGRCALKIENPP